MSNDGVTITFKQAIGASDALRTGSYTKTLTFTLVHHHALTVDSSPRPSIRWAWR